MDQPPPITRLAPVLRAPAQGLALPLAWAIEIMAVGMGLFLAVLAGVEGSASGVAAGVVASLPFVMLAAIELTKIPIVQSLFAAAGRFWRVFGTLMLLVVTLATFENFVFGFERAFASRTDQVARLGRDVAEAHERLGLAEAASGEAEARLAALDARARALRQDFEAARGQAREDIADAQRQAERDPLAEDRARLQAERALLAQRRDAEIAANQRACRAPGSAVPCNPRGIERAYAPRLAALDQEEARLRDEVLRRERDARAQIASAREARGAEQQAVEARLAALSAEQQAERGALAAAQAARAAAARHVVALEFAQAQAIEASQMHRLARVLTGSAEPEAVAAVTKLFVLSLAGIVASIGSCIAALDCAARLPPRPPAEPPARPARRPLARALRAFLAARRRRQVRRVVERVEVPVERVKLVFLPLNATEQEIARARWEASGGATRA